MSGSPADGVDGGGRGSPEQAAGARQMIILALGLGAVCMIGVLLWPFAPAILVSGRAQLHPLIVFFSVLGAIFVFGAVGILIGPILFVICLSLIETARLVLEPAEGKGPASEGERLLDRVSLGTFRAGAPGRASSASRASGPEGGEVD